jgi:hypothetical protein
VVRPFYGAFLVGRLTFISASMLRHTAASAGGASWQLAYNDLGLLVRAAEKTSPARTRVVATLLDQLAS